uniref:Uncharacterized protein n=1 Tax=Populus trichocarpa TaxID=3694 RepID=A0A3N7FX70_POPTR
MPSVASTLSRSSVFYYSSTMAIGIDLVILVVPFQVGLGTFLFRYLPGLLHSILMEMGISKDMHYPCVSEYLTGDDNACPASDCKEQLGSDVVFSEATLRRRISDNLDASSSNSAFDDTSISMRSSASVLRRWHIQTRQLKDQ